MYIIHLIGTWNQGRRWHTLNLKCQLSDVVAFHLIPFQHSATETQVHRCSPSGMALLPYPQDHLLSSVTHTHTHTPQVTVTLRHRWFEMHWPAPGWMLIQFDLPSSQWEHLRGSKSSFKTSLIVCFSVKDLGKWAANGENVTRFNLHSPHGLNQLSSLLIYREEWD